MSSKQSLWSQIMEALVGRDDREPSPGNYRYEPPKQYPANERQGNPVDPDSLDPYERRAPASKPSPSPTR